MIFVSTANVAHRSIKDSVAELVAAGFRRIELSGGTQYYPTYKDDLLELKAKHGLEYRVHNYFPPPAQPFVLNLAAADPAVVARSQELIRRAIDLSVELGGREYGFHAGFRISPRSEELGKPIAARNIQPFEEAVERFVAEFRQARDYAESRGVEIFIENNVVSAKNYQNFGGENPFLLTSQADFLDLQARCPFRLLLDVAHLKVSCRTLGRDFEAELPFLVDRSNYLHFSDNDGTADANLRMERSGDLFRSLSALNLRGKTMTVEVGDSIEGGVRTYQLLEELAGK